MAVLTSFDIGFGYSEDHKHVKWLSIRIDHFVRLQFSPNLKKPRSQEKKLLYKSICTTEDEDLPSDAFST